MANTETPVVQQPTVETQKLVFTITDVNGRVHELEVEKVGNEFPSIHMFGDNIKLVDQLQRILSNIVRNSNALV